MRYKMKIKKIPIGVLLTAEQSNYIVREGSSWLRKNNIIIDDIKKVPLYRDATKEEVVKWEKKHLVPEPEETTKQL